MNIKTPLTLFVYIYNILYNYMGQFTRKLPIALYIYKVIKMIHFEIATSLEP